MAGSRMMRMVVIGGCGLALMGLMPGRAEGADFLASVMTALKALTGTKTPGSSAAPAEPVVLPAPVPEVHNKLRTGPGAAAWREIALKEPIELDGRTREDVLRIRAEAAGLYAELFDTPYTPSPQVFGAIVDGRPWWGIEGQFCTASGGRSADGASEETRFLLNPFILLGIDEGRAFDLAGAPCAAAYPRPLSLEWSADQARAEIIYDLARFYRERSAMPAAHKFLNVLQLVDLNARDMGYGFIQLDVERSQNIVPVQGAKMFAEPVALKGYLHCGGSCGIEGGCNNGSPDQPDLKFAVTGHPASLHCRLWRVRPVSSSQTPDFVFVIDLY